MEREVPGGIPGVLPFVRHRDDVAVVHMVPIAVSRCGLAQWVERIGTSFFQPLVYIVEVELLAPKHARKSLARHSRGIFIQIRRNYRGVELIGFSLASGKNLVE